ncbi:chemotaxis protein CheR [Bacillus coahuilensis p1.1.43]|uniref:Chemotaxis protein CheR n=1 Tax=Bacillus coahuilensis p1.1.43 TaxID=1150625 RepID=A0A147KBS0_9BACI|nr:protein-glutamate O-methyltransferase CheR [Bacillus coahuilensis]KUP08832.1 chemotaxis protein CheR [Bacillus coahuilensis p1.1.43]
MKKEEIELDLLLDALYRLTGYEFRQYMRSSLHRRVKNRLSIEGLPTISRLTEKIIHDITFRDKLLGDFSINVTEMFRDPLFFKAIREQVLPKMKDLPEIRIWHAGCSTGEEAYSMAILMEEEGLIDRVKIYATDMNEVVLKVAEEGRFSLQKMQSYTRNYLQAGGKHSFSEYYTTDREGAYLLSRLRDRITFAQHNLVTDGSFNEFHMIICRNVLIYFNRDLQLQVLHLFNNSLSKSGFLGLGSKEAIHSDISFLEEFEAKQKIYRKKPDTHS